METVLALAKRVSIERGYYNQVGFGACEMMKGERGTHRRPVPVGRIQLYARLAQQVVVLL